MKRETSKKLVIYGSCVSRDPCEFLGLRESLEYFHARSNIASLSCDVPINLASSLEFLDGFNRRCVSADLTKAIRLDFKNSVVVFDFIDDRFPTAMDRETGAMVTFNYLVAEAEPEIYRGLNLVRHFEPSQRAVVDENVARFSERYRHIFENNTTILHQASFGKYFNGSIPSSESRKIFEDYFEYLFDKMKSFLHFDHIIDLRYLLDNCDATPADHKWGHAPFHFSDAYNLAFAKEVKSILNDA